MVGWFTDLPVLPEGLSRPEANDDADESSSTEAVFRL
jgi:hypothetical protein